MSRRALLAAAIGIAVAASAAQAQQPGSRIRGEVVKADGGMLVLQTREGATLNVKVADDARVGALVKAALADIKNDSFIGIAGMPQPDGSIQAFSVHIFLPAQRGVVPDRHTPWDARPGSTMTNAYVESMVQEKSGESFMVKYKDGEKKIVVTPETVIAAAAPGSKDELKPGAQIIIFGWDKQPDGSVLAKVMYVGRGVAPAM
jgi:hypothetical protein